MKEYELTYIVRPDMEDEAVATLSARFEQTITSNGGRVIKTDRWGKRRLAYEISGTREGIYVFLRVSAETAAVAELERTLRLNEQVIRHMAVRAIVPAKKSRYKVSAKPARSMSGAAMVAAAIGAPAPVETAPEAPAAAGEDNGESQ